jgi:ribosomal protein L37AE/L43A
MVEGPNDVYICAPCLHRTKAIILVMGGTPQCSFCGKHAAGARSVEGPSGIHMCADCVEAGLAIVPDHEVRR